MEEKYITPPELDIILREPLGRLDRVEREFSKFRDTVMQRLIEEIHEMQVNAGRTQVQLEQITKELVELRSFNVKLLWWIIGLCITIITFMAGIIIKFSLGV